MSDAAVPPLSGDEVAKLRALVETHGQNEAARLIGVSRHLLLSGAADLPLRRGSLLAIRFGLAAIAQAA